MDITLLSWEMCNILFDMTENSNNSDTCDQSKLKRNDLAIRKARAVTVFMNYALY